MGKDVRSKATQLAQATEFEEMFRNEAQRLPTSGQHFGDFSSAQKWLYSLGIQSELFKLDDFNSVTEEAERIKPDLIDKTLATNGHSLFTDIENYLGFEDTVQVCDFAFVFGSKSLLRVDTAVEMYKIGTVKKLIMIGKGPFYESEGTVEAEIFARRAMELGVPEDDILLEKQSFNIASNVKGTLNLLDDMGLKYSKIMQILPWFAQRRGWVTMKKYVTAEVIIVRKNAMLSRGSKFEKGEWYKHSEAIEIVFNEFVKIKHQHVTNTG